jgi:hypothetical protein
MDHEEAKRYRQQIMFNNEGIQLPFEAIFSSLLTSFS